MNACHLKDTGGKNSEDFSALSACCWGGKSLCVLPPGPPLTHNAVLLCGSKYPKDKSKGWQRMKMKRRVGACCASEWGHGSAVSPRCWLVFDVQNSDWAWFLMLCNFEDGVFEVMHELDSFPASSWFVCGGFFVFFFKNISFFSWSIFFNERHKLCVWSERMFQGYLPKHPLWSGSLLCSSFNCLSQIIVAATFPHSPPSYTFYTLSKLFFLGLSILFHICEYTVWVVG